MPPTRSNALTNDVLLQCRAVIPALHNKSYFNFGGQGTMPQPVMDAVISAYQFVQTRGPFSTAIFSWIVDELTSTRKRLATEFGGTPECYVLTQNVSEGCNIVTWGMDWAPGDIILLTDCEHPSLVDIAKTVAKRTGAVVEYFEVLTASPQDILKRLKAAIKPKTKLVAISHVLWNTGQVLPLKEMTAISHENGVKILVDGAQSIGAFPVNLADLNVDYYAFTGHKWLCGPEGIGSLYIRKDLLGELKPTFVGWRGSEMLPQGSSPHASNFEVATSAFPLLSGFRSALNFHSRWGTVQDRHTQILQNARYLRELLVETDKFDLVLADDPQCGLVSFTAKARKRNGEIVAQCEARHCLVRTIPDKPHCIRASLHYFTSREEIENLVSTLTSQI